MSGIKTTTQDFAQSFQKLKAMEAADTRKQKAIDEIYLSYRVKGFSEMEARRQAMQEYQSRHKNQLQ